MVVDWGAMSKRGDRAQDRERAKKNHSTNKEIRKKEKKERKRRQVKYLKKTRAAKAKVVMAPKVIPPVIEDVVLSAAIYSMVPDETEFPTATLVGNALPTPGPIVPWNLGGTYQLQTAASILGWTMIFVRSKLVASFAMGMLGKLTEKEHMGKFQFTVAPGGGVNIRLHTGRSHNKMGQGATAPLRPRPEGGEMPQMKKDPYDQPSEWYEFWKWTF